MKTKFLDTIQLEEMEQVKLMNRTDTKYWFHFKHLQELLQEIKNDYFVLEINQKSELPYSTTYYDTLNNSMFLEHHNGKLNRYKVRRRSYVSSEISFLEMKFKNNKGRTIKKRISSGFGNIMFTEKENEFLRKFIPFSPEELYPSLLNRFSRMTLVNKNFKERCTIDLNIQFVKGGRTTAFENLVIVEIKSEGRCAKSPLAIALRDQRIKTSGFSKYCMGRAATDAVLKRNGFKEKIRRIEKTIQSNINLYHFN